MSKSAFYIAYKNSDIPPNTGHQYTGMTVPCDATYAFIRTCPVSSYSRNRTPTMAQAQNGLAKLHSHRCRCDRCNPATSPDLRLWPKESILAKRKYDQVCLPGSWAGSLPKLVGCQVSLDTLTIAEMDEWGRD